MALSLKDPETDRLARVVSAMMGESITVAVRTALAERMARERLRRGRPGDLAAKLDEITRRMAELPDIDTRSADDIIGYDENGMWR